MFEANTSKIEIGISMALYRYNAKPMYHEKCRHANGFIYYIKGGHHIDFNDFSIETEAGDFMYLPYNETYSNRLKEKHTEYYQIDFLLYENGKPVRLFDKARLFPSETSEKLLPLIKRIYETYSEDSARGKLLCISDIIRIIAIIKGDEASGIKQNKGMDKIRNTVSHIRECYYLDTPASQLAAMSNMCVSNLEKLFKKVFGMSPLSYRNKIRIEHAKKLLLGGYSIADAASMTGFSDCFYFSRCFKRLTGISPGEYKNNGESI